MCGIAGFFPLDTKHDAAQSLNIALNMHTSLAHRGPDRGDVWQDEENGLTLTHRRLAIIDLSDDGAQPMYSPSGRYIITFNGEIYNYLELRRQLEIYGIALKGKSDTEVMLAGFDVWGIEQTIAKINGMFAFVLYDRQEKYLHFVRDRFGKKPLYLGWAGKSLVFASELKGIMAHPDFVRQINNDALSIYMKYGYVHAPYSIFNGIWQLLPASILSINLANVSAGENLASKMKIFWSLKSVVEEGLKHPIRKSDVIITQEFENKLMHAIDERMIADVPLGAFLSGGIDSSIVVALMQKKSTAPIKTYTIGFEQKGFNEAEYAKKIATHLRTDHHEFYVSDQDALDVVPQLADIYDEPFADQSQIPTYLISKAARGQVTVVLTGDGGDEILGGYDRHTKIPALWNKTQWMPHLLRKNICQILNLPTQEFYGLIKMNNPQFGAQVKRAISLMGLKNADDIYDALISSWPEGDKAVIHGQMPLIALHDKLKWPQNLDFTNTMIYGDLLSYRPNDLMVKTDRASMAVSLEARAPLMDYELCEYAWRLPAHLKIRGGQGKYILRDILKKYVPEELYDRPKMGFSVPLNDWLKGSLKEWAGDLLSPDALKNQGLLDTALINDLWKNFQNNEDFQPVRKDLWSIIMFQAWYNRWMKY